MGADLAALREQYSKQDIRPAARIAQAHVIEMLNYIGVLEEAILGAAELLYPLDDWGPKPPGAGASYRSYVSECVGEEAIRIRDEWKARGWRRG